CEMASAPPSSASSSTCRGRSSDALLMGNALLMGTITTFAAVVTAGHHVGNGARHAGSREVALAATPTQDTLPDRGAEGREPTKAPAVTARPRNDLTPAP